jgi:hypothetical protein
MDKSEPIYDYKNNEYYIKYNKQKEELKKKYPPRLFEDIKTNGRSKEHIQALSDDYIENDRQLHQEYLKELADLIFEPIGNFQQFTWDMIGEVELKEMKRKARGRLNRWSGEY